LRTDNQFKRSVNHVTTCRPGQNMYSQKRHGKIVLTPPTLLDGLVSLLYQPQLQ